MPENNIQSFRKIRNVQKEDKWMKVSKVKKIAIMSQNDKRMVKRAFHKTNEERTFNKKMSRVSPFIRTIVNGKPLFGEAPLSHTRGSPYPAARKSISSSELTNGASYQSSVINKPVISNFVSTNEYDWSFSTVNGAELLYARQNKRESILESIREAGVCPQIPSKRNKRGRAVNLSQFPVLPVSTFSPVFTGVSETLHLSIDNKVLLSSEPSLSKEAVYQQNEEKNNPPLALVNTQTSNHYIQLLYTLVQQHKAATSSSLPTDDQQQDTIPLNATESPLFSKENDTEADFTHTDENTASFIKDDMTSYPTAQITMYKPLFQDGPISNHSNQDQKLLEKEYWRRQRRIFLRTRFITDEEAADIAQEVYPDKDYTSHYRSIASFLSNMANYRTRWRKNLRRIAKRISVVKEQIESMPESCFLDYIAGQIDHQALETVWKYWITEPYVEPNAFYANSDSVDRLTAITACAVYFTIRVMHGYIKEGQYRKALKELDSYGLSRMLTLN
ncbi:hypothetical protein BDF14DRAFT_1992321 [Spinellus fusiger]|nr:hypothetical protein BDF14DRAFT_1992321 [Spinellus fusiger]